MTGKNSTPLIGWHSTDPTLKPWIEAEAASRGMTMREVLDEMAAEYRERLNELAPFRDASEARTVNREITGHLKSCTETGDPS